MKTREDIEREFIERKICESIQIFIDATHESIMSEPTHFKGLAERFDPMVIDDKKPIRGPIKL